MWEPSALCPAHVPTGWGTPLPVAVGSRADARDATDARDSPPPRPPCHTGITGMPPAVARARGPASPPPQAHFRPPPSRRLPSGRQLLRRCRHSSPCHPGSSLQFATSPGPHLSARRWWPNLKVGVLADLKFIVIKDEKIKNESVRNNERVYLWWPTTHTPTGNKRGGTGSLPPGGLVIQGVIVIKPVGEEPPVGLPCFKGLQVGVS